MHQPLRAPVSVPVVQATGELSIPKAPNVLVFGDSAFSLSALEELPAHLEARIHKQWAHALGIPTQEAAELTNAPHLAPYIQFDRALRIVSGTLRFSFHSDSGFQLAVLTSNDQQSLIHSLSSAIFKQELLDKLNGGDFFKDLIHDHDRLPKDLDKISPDRARAETARVVRDELIPALISSLIGELGVPLRRGSQGFDIQCADSASASKIGPVDVQIKVLYHDSPIFNRDLVTGKMQFFKLVAVLAPFPPTQVKGRAILLQANATEQQMAELRDDLVSAGVSPENILLLGHKRLELSGIKIPERERPAGLQTQTAISLDLDLQQYLRFVWAHKFCGPAPLLLSAPGGNEPIEIKLLKSNGCYEIIEFLQENHTRLA